VTSVLFCLVVPAAMVLITTSDRISVSRYRFDRQRAPSN